MNKNHILTQNPLISFKMESITLLRKHLAMCGVCIQQSSQKHPFNARNAAVSIVISIGVILYVKQLYETNTFEEYADIIYSMVSACFFIAIFLSIVHKAPKLFQLIDDFNNIVGDSK